MKKELAAIALSQGTGSNTLDLTLKLLRDKDYDVIGLPEEYNSDDFSLKKSPFVKLTINFVYVTKSAKERLFISVENAIFSIIKTRQQTPREDVSLSQQYIKFPGGGFVRVVSSTHVFESNWQAFDDFNETLSSSLKIQNASDQLNKVRLKITLADRSYSGNIGIKVGGSTYSMSFTDGVGIYDVFPIQNSETNVEIYDVVESIAFTPLDSNDAYVAGGATIADEEITCQSEDVEIFSVTESAE